MLADCAERGAHLHSAAAPAMEPDGAKRERDDAADAAAAAEQAPAAKAPRADDDAAAAAAPQADAPTAPAAAPKERPNGKKRQVVVLLGYVGAGSQGMQRNPGARTIEDELERAFHAAGGISNENMGDFSKARAPRDCWCTGLAADMRCCVRADSVDARGAHGQGRQRRGPSSRTQGTRAGRALRCGVACGAPRTSLSRRPLRHSFASSRQAWRTASTPRYRLTCVS